MLGSANWSGFSEFLFCQLKQNKFDCTYITEKKKSLFLKCKKSCLLHAHIALRSSQFAVKGASLWDPNSMSACSEFHLDNGAVPARLCRLEKPLSFSRSVFKWVSHVLWLTLQLLLCTAECVPLLSNNGFPHLHLSCAHCLASHSSFLVSFHFSSVLLLIMFHLSKYKKYYNRSLIPLNASLKGA